MKLSQLQGAEYILKELFKIDKPLLIEFNNHLASFRTIHYSKEKLPRNLIKNELYFGYTKDDFFDFCYDGLYQKLATSNFDYSLPTWTNNEMFALLETVDYVSNIQRSEVFPILYDIEFIDLDLKSSFYIVDRDTEFNIVGFKD